MAEYIDKEQLLSDLYSKQDDENLDVMLEIANFPAADVVSESAYKQIMWERDLAIQQLRSDYGVGLGEKKNVDVAPVRHGKWRSMYNCSNSGVYCSECNKSVLNTEYRKNVPIKSKYCPNCGSKMDGGDEDAAD